MTEQTSPLGIYFVRGASTDEDVFYYRTNDPDQFIMVPQNQRLRASQVFRPEEDRKDWEPMGVIGSGAHFDVAITTQTLATHTWRIIEGLLYETNRLRESYNQIAARLPVAGGLRYYPHLEETR